MISKSIRDALKAQLSASGSGLNDRLNQLAPSYGIDDPYQIDFSETSTNFMMGQIDPDKVEETSVLTYPLMTLDTGSAQDLGLIFSAIFSGPVVGMIDVHHSWADESVIADFSSLVDMTEAAIIACLKDSGHQNWGAGVLNLLLRKGGIQSQRSRVAFGGQNWRQSLRILAVFELAV